MSHSRQRWFQWRRRLERAGDSGEAGDTGKGACSSASFTSDIILLSVIMQATGPETTIAGTIPCTEVGEEGRRDTG